MGEGNIRRATRQATARLTPNKVSEIVAIGRISEGMSVTYIPFRSMPSADEVCATAVRKVIRALRAGQKRK